MLKNKLFKEINSKYVIGFITVMILLVSTGFSFSLFTVSREAKSSLNIVTGKLYSVIESDDLEDDAIVVLGNTKKNITLKVSNVNSIRAKVNLYYGASITDNLKVGFLGSGDDAPTTLGKVLEKDGDVGSSLTVNISIENLNTSEVIVTFGSDAGLPNKSLVFPDDKIVVEKFGISPIKTAIFDTVKLGSNGAINTTDPKQTFITGTNPNNYVWYSGKLWRAISYDTTDNSVKLVSQWNQTATVFNAGGTNSFSESSINSWLNNTSSTGFLGSLYDYKNFIKLDSNWSSEVNTSPLGSISRPNDDTIATVGLLNIYEYQMSYNGATTATGYLNNGLTWWTMTPQSSNSGKFIDYNGDADYFLFSSGYGVRPVINIKSTVRVSEGDGTINNPYRLSGDDEKISANTSLNTRKSGEYISFGNGGTYRIVDVESGSTKVVSDTALKTNNNYLIKKFDINDVNVKLNANDSYNIGYFLNNDFLNPANGYLTTDEVNKIDTAHMWDDVSLRVGLLKADELLSGQFDNYANNISYWTLTVSSSVNIRGVNETGSVDYYSASTSAGVKPSFYLKSDIKIISGDGTKQHPFVI